MKIPSDNRIGLRTRSRPTTAEQYKEHEERLWNEIKEFHSLPSLEGEDTKANTEPTTRGQVRDLLVGTMRHYEKRGQWFSQNEVRIAFRAWEIVKEQGKFLPTSLSEFLYAALSPHISGSQSRFSKKNLARTFNSKKEKSSALLQDIVERQGYVNWCALAMQNPNTMVFLRTSIEAPLKDPEEPTRHLISDGSTGSEWDIPYKAIEKEVPKSGEMKSSSAGQNDPPSILSSTKHLSDPEKRQLMLTLQKNERWKVRDMFYSGGHVAGQVLPTHWPVALATNDEGYRYLSDRRLNELIPDWKQLITGKKRFKNGGREWQEGWKSWRQSQEKKVQMLHNSWPGPYDLKKVQKEGMGRERKHSDVLAHPNTRATDENILASANAKKQDQNFSAESDQRTVATSVSAPAMLNELVVSLRVLMEKQEKQAKQVTEIRMKLDELLSEVRMMKS